MVNQELATIKEYDIPVIVAILNNRKLEWLSMAKSFV